MITMFPSSDADAKSSESYFKDKQFTLARCYFILYLQLRDGSLLSSSWINTVSSLLQLTTLFNKLFITVVLKIEIRYLLESPVLSSSGTALVRRST